MGEIDVASLSLSRLQALIAIADHGSYAAASDVLGVPAPTLWRRVKSLEDALGLLLARGVEGDPLTEAGVVLVDYARGVLEKAREATAVAADLHVRRLSHVAAGGFPAHHALFLARCLKLLPDTPTVDATDFLDRNRTDGGAELLKKVSDGRLDLAIAPTQQHDAELVDLPLYATEVAVFGEFGSGPSISVQQLFEERLLLSPESHRSHKRLQRLAEDKSFNFEVADVHESTEVLIAWAREGAGRAVLPVDALYALAPETPFTLIHDAAKYDLVDHYSLYVRPTSLVIDFAQNLGVLARTRIEELDLRGVSPDFSEPTTT